MKKLLKNNLFITSSLLSTLIIPNITISCYKENKEEKINLNESSLYKKNDLSTNTIIKNLIDFQFKNNNTEIENFINWQNNILDTKIEELANALMWYPIFRGDKSIESAQLYSKLVTNSKEILKQTINKDWLWFLNHLNNFKFVFNPYGEYYRDEDDYQTKSFEYVSKNLFQDLVYKNENINITNYIEFVYPELNFEYKNKNLTSFYLILNQRSAIKGFKYVDINENHVVKIIPDILIFNNVNENKTINEFIKEYETLFKEEWKLKYSKEIEYWTNIDEEYIPNVINQINDIGLLNDFSLIHSEISYQAIKKMNENSLNTFRFTWRFANVKN
ncbi:Uncharacterised protein [Metamycoplasma cloacale]|uniref:Uncharacterized protein n=1 Tax=Metamycoplasma cloacale TaxID=92401 RepID=A0A2Z4LM93_9BACT|nr:aromatic motif membrane protein [Metamycoplasma cloacale]AWX42856.1 hypothetical protein DK849_02150 [Metamycoplasma cloacale]VEU79322.1 Uncharacterised protein [Metamycoplasma cloacale]